MIGWWRRRRLQNEVNQVFEELAASLPGQLNALFTPEDGPDLRRRAALKLDGWLKMARLGARRYLRLLRDANPRAWELCGRADPTSESRDLLVGGYREHALRTFKAQRLELVQFIANLRAKRPG